MVTMITYTIDIPIVLLNNNIITTDIRYPCNMSIPAIIEIGYRSSSWSLIYTIAIPSSSSTPLGSILFFYCWYRFSSIFNFVSFIRSNCFNMLRTFTCLFWSHSTWRCFSRFQTILWNWNSSFRKNNLSIWRSYFLWYNSIIASNTCSWFRNSRLLISMSSLYTKKVVKPLKAQKQHQKSTYELRNVEQHGKNYFS